MRKSSGQGHQPTAQTKANQKAGSPMESSLKVKTNKDPLVGVKQTGSTKIPVIVVHEGIPGARTGAGRSTSEGVETSYKISFVASLALLKSAF